jgi:hypothetical protein
VWLLDDAADGRLIAIAILDAATRDLGIPWRS